MKVLFINQFFWPDTAATGQLLADVVRGMDPEQHSVTVICGHPGYGEVDSSDRPSAKIRVCGGPKFSNRTWGRVVSYGSYLAGAFWACLTEPRPDIVVTMTTPPLTSVLGALLQRLRGSRHFIWEMDVYPDIAVDLGVVSKGSLIDRAVGVLGDWARRRADGVIVLGEDMKARLVARAVPEEKLIVAENWADGELIRPLPIQQEGPLTVLYSGNFGLAHELETILGAIRALRNHPNFNFRFVGSGSRRQTLEQICRKEQIRNVEFLPYLVRSKLGESLSGGHLGLVTQIPATCGSVVPSKVYGILASGRPLLFIGPAESTPTLIIDRHQCGWRIAPGNVDGLVELLAELAERRDVIGRAGARARNTFEQFYDREQGVARILAAIGVAASKNTKTSQPKTGRLAASARNQA